MDRVLDNLFYVIPLEQGINFQRSLATSSILWYNPGSSQPSLLQGHIDNSWSTCCPPEQPKLFLQSCFLCSYLPFQIKYWLPFAFLMIFQLKAKVITDKKPSHSNYSQFQVSFKMKLTQNQSTWKYHTFSFHALLLANSNLQYPMKTYESLRTAVLKENFK